MIIILLFTTKIRLCLNKITINYLLSQIFNATFFISIRYFLCFFYPNIILIKAVIIKHARTSGKLSKTIRETEKALKALNIAVRKG